MSNSHFRKYKRRTIAFHKVYNFGEWRVKLYTITPHEEFQHDKALKIIKQVLPDLLKRAKDHHSVAFVILHEGTDGIWTLVNWWTGKEMLHTDTYFSDFDELTKLELNPKSGSMVCVWEIPIIQHERNAWVKHILMNANKPEFDKYFLNKLEVQK